MSTLYPDYRDSYLFSLSPNQLAQIPDKEKKLVVCPVGAIEQHGHHLPVGTDSIAAHSWIALMLERLTAEDLEKVWVGPAIPIGKSNEHTGFPGTLSISASMLRTQVLALAKTIHSMGFRRLAIINGHGGNVSVLRYSLEEASVLYGMECFLLKSSYRSEMSRREATYGIHAGEGETSWLLHFCPEHVRFEKADCQWIGPEEEPEGTLLRPEFASVTYSWVSADISPTGTMGDATKASPEKGAEWVEGIANGYAENLKSHLHAI